MTFLMSFQFGTACKCSETIRLPDENLIDINWAQKPRIWRAKVVRHHLLGAKKPGWKQSWKQSWKRSCEAKLEAKLRSEAGSEAIQLQADLKLFHCVIHIAEVERA